MGAGRPPRYRTAEEMQEVIDEYFERCEKKPLIVDGKQKYNSQGYPIMIQNEKPSVTGLAYALGFSARSDLLYYQKKEEFRYTVTRAKLKVESFLEQKVLEKDSSNGAQFVLRANFKWDDKKQEEKKTEGITIVNNIPRE